MTNAFKNSNVTSTAITVTNAGTYLVNYGFNASSTAGSALSLYQNGTEINSSRLLLRDDVGEMSGSIIIALAAGDTLSLGASVIVTNLVLPAGALNAYVTLTPIYI